MTAESKKQRVFLALADPKRRQIVEILSAGGPQTATELAQELPITRQGVSKHLQILVKAELVQVQKSGRERYYHFVASPLDEASSWVTAVNEQWDRRLQALSQYLSEDQNETNGGDA
jgi:predicted ArsR family transcriptional regulator